MPNCVKCGEEISEEQYYKFKVMCPNCVRMQLLNKSANVGKRCVICFISISVVSFLILFLLMFLLG